jgi:hypothetical protein
MKFKVGDVVCLQHKTYIRGVSTTRGYITSNAPDYDPTANVIEWEDGEKGAIHLYRDNKYLLLV